MTRDLCLLFFYTLPGPPRNFRLYWLLFIRMVIYGCEGVIVYSLVLTIVVGEDEEEPGMLVELTRLLLCHASEQAGTVRRDKRAINNTNPSWLALLSDVNQTFPELSQVLDNLAWSSATPMGLLGTDPTTFPASTTEPATSPDYHTNALSFEDPTFSSTPNTSLTGELTSDPRSVMRGYRLGWCVEVLEINTSISTLTCSSSFMGPICVMLVICLVSAALGFACRAIDGNLGTRDGPATVAVCNATRPVPTNPPTRMV